MSLDTLRKDIDKIDSKILDLFEKRMDTSEKIAEIKIKENLPVYQADREKQVIDDRCSKSPQELRTSTEVLFKSIMDISKCKQQQFIYKDNSSIKYIPFDKTQKCNVGCQGTIHSYSETASIKLFPYADLSYFQTFENVFQALDKGTIDFGILPIQNSTVGSVFKTYELMKKYNFYINASVCVKVDHCLAVKKGTDISNVYDVYSHEQALAQCSNFIQENKLNPISYSNTALAAQMVAESDSIIAAICSKECAENLHLEIAEENITNESENYTRFICISKHNYVSNNADVVSVSLTLPHTPGALYRLLTKFSVAGLNLLRIESKPLSGKDFNVIFYLDFQGSIKNESVCQTIAALQAETDSFKYLGNYKEEE